MRYAMIMAGGSGTRLWPMSTSDQPKQLIPFIRGKSLIQIAVDRLEGLVPADRRCICAGQDHRGPIVDRVTGISADRYYAEPVGRDTVNAVGLVASVLEREDPDAVIAVFTADHLIEPVDRFVQIVERGYALAEARPDTLVTFGIEPTHAATGYGYLELGEAIAGEGFGEARLLEQFKEKPDADAAGQYLDAGPGKYLWNSGMFVWRAATVVACLRRFAPDNHAGLAKIADAWGTADQQQVLEREYPNLPKISVDYAIMEPASKDEQVAVAAIAMDVRWLDVGSWPSYADTCDRDEASNAIGADKVMLLDSENTLVASDDPEHLIATIGTQDLVIVHTARATLVCPRDQAERIKELHGRVKETFGEDYV